MATKKKKKKAPAHPARRGRKRGRGPLYAVIALLLIAVAALALFLFKRPKPEIPVNAGLALSVGTHGNAPGALDSPRGIAMAPNGDIYVADLANSRIAVYGGDGAFKFVFGKQGAEPGKAKPGEFNEPSGVAVGPDSTVYVADAWNGRIQKFDAKGKPMGEYGGSRYSFYSPRNVAVDAQGNLYVADTGNSMVKVIDPAGKMFKSIGGPGKADGLFSETFGVAVNSRGEVFVADHGNHRIQKFSALPGLNFVKSAKVKGWAEVDPFWPMLACDRQDLVYASDENNHKVWIYDADLNYRGTIGSGPVPAPFQSPLGLAFAPTGELWVSDMGNNRLLKLSPFTVPVPAR